MKRFLTMSILLLFSLIVFAACGGNSAPTPPLASPESIEPEVMPQFVSVVDFDGNKVQVMQNPTTVAIFDYGVLDMLYRVGWERTGIELVLIPTKENLPDEFAWFRNQPTSSVATGGTLFYINWDILDIAQPELVILGARSFGMNAAGDRLNPEEREEFTQSTFNRYQNTTFLNLAHNAQVAHQIEDMTRNVTALGQIFSHLHDDLWAIFNDITTEVNEIYVYVTQHEIRALFAITGTPTTMSVFLTNSRYSMIYDEFGFTPVIDDDFATWMDQHGFDTTAGFVLETNPEVIFLLDRSDVVGTGAGSTNFLNDSIIRLTDAYKAGHIYILNGGPWYTITTGFTGAQAMIYDINRFLNAR